MQIAASVLFHDQTFIFPSSSDGEEINPKVFQALGNEKMKVLMWMMLDCLVWIASIMMDPQYLLYLCVTSCRCLV